MSFEHTSVLVAEALHYLALSAAGQRLIDGTVGGGGHAAAVLAAVPGVQLLGLDRDDQALAAAGGRLAGFGDQVHLERGEYSRMQEFCQQYGWDKVDAVLLDIGVSSPQLDMAERGFSYRFDGPLDMRMDRRAALSAATLLNTRSEDELTRIFRDYGEERQARRIARAVVARRAERPWARTGELAELVAQVIGYNAGGPPAPTRVFQALRIAVNSELEELRQGLRAALEILKPGGRLVVITFQSLEDRIVKNLFREAAKSCVCPPDFPVCRCDKQQTLKVLTPKPVRPSAAELERNRRAAPAKLRAAEKI